jgi:signal transduction histidine kinase/CheY-like chemotaxis protein
MNRLFFALLLLCMSYGAWCQNKKLDSLYTELRNHTREDSVRALLLVSICYYEYTANNEKNKALAAEALRISKKINYTRGVGMALKYHSLYYWVNGNYEQAIVYAIEMLKAFEGTADKLGVSQSYNLLGLIYERSKEFDKAEAYYFRALEVRQKAGLRKDVAYSYNSLGSLSFSQGQYDDALAYFHKSLDIRKEIHDEEALSQTYGNIAAVHVTKKDYIRALEYSQKAFELLKNSPNKYRIAVNLSTLGEIYIHLKKYALAESYLFKAESLAKNMRHKEVLVETYSRFRLLENSRGRFKSAMDYSELMHTYKDSIYTENKAKQIAEAEALYESEKKDRKILELEQHEQFQKLKQRYLLIALLTVISVFLLIYLLQRSHNKKIRSFLELQKSLNQKLQETDQLKSKFFANISHEFRTPLSLILAPVEAKLLSPGLMKSDRESFMLIRRNANRLHALINQLLDLSKLEAGKMELQIQKGDIIKFVREICASFDSLAEHKEIRFLKNLPSGMDDGWYDRDKLEKIFNNLLSNAFKFTPSGGKVELAVDGTAASGELNIRIMDTGKGIPTADLPHIFSPFYQSNYTADDGHPGTGIGLSLVHELVRLYGGTVAVESNMNVGSIFSVTLPIAENRFPPSTVKVIVNEVQSIASRKIESVLTDGPSVDEADTEIKKLQQDVVLVIEDNCDLRNFISANLSDAFSILTAQDGEEGLTMAVNHIPNLIISDVMMPVMDGIEFAEKIKSDERTCHIPIVLLTAKADLESRIEGWATGADDYLSKPFSTVELRVRVKNLLAQRKKLANYWQ